MGKIEREQLSPVFNSELNKINTDLSDLTNKIADTGWIPLTLNNGLISGQTCRVRRIGDIIFVEGTVKGITGNNFSILTFPAGFRTVSKAMVTRFTSGIGEVSTVSSGVLKFENNRVGNITINDNLEINLCFIAYDI